MMGRKSHLGCLLVVLTTLCTPSSGFGQVLLEGQESLDFDRPESWAMKVFASLAIPTGFGGAAELEPGEIDLGFEVDSVPSLSRRQRTVGFNGTKEEDINRTSLFGRPRIAVGLANRFTLDASLVPPVDISGVEPTILSLGIARELGSRENVAQRIRLVVQRGTFEGDFTCSAAEIRNGPNPFDCEEPSRDEMTVESATLEYAARLKRGGSRLNPYLSVAVSQMDMEFLVRAEYQGLVDRTSLVADGTTYSVAVGVARAAVNRFGWAAEVFYSPLDVVRPPRTASENDAFINARVLLTYRIR